MAKELKIKFTGDASGLRKATGEADGILSGFSSKIGAFSVAAGTLLADGIKTGFRAAAGFLGDAVGGASDLAESMSKVSQLFGPATSDITSFAEGAATSLGQSKQQALDAASTFAAFGKAAGLSTDDLTRFAKVNTEMASDMASFFNTSPEEAIEKIGAAFRGESEPIRSFGVLLDANSVKAKAVALGLVDASVDMLKLSKAQETAEKAARKHSETIAKYGDGSVEAGDAARDLEQAQMALAEVTEGSIPDLNAQQKILATQALIMEQGSAAMGDFALTSDGLANKQRILAAQFTNLKTNIGTALLPVVLDMVNLFSDRVMPVLEKFGPIVGEKLAGAFRALSGWVSKVADAFRAGGWTEAMAVAGEKLRDLYVAYVDWLYTTALPAIGGFLLELGKRFGAWVGDTAVPYLKENLPLWLAAFSEWFESTAWPWIVEKAGQLAEQMGVWVQQAAVYLTDNLPGWLGAFVEWFTGTAFPWMQETSLKMTAAFADWVLDAAVKMAENLPGWMTKLETWVRTEAVPKMVGFGAEMAGAVASGLISGLWAQYERVAIEIRNWVKSVVPSSVSNLIGGGGGGGGEIAGMTSQRFTSTGLAVAGVSAAVGAPVINVNSPLGRPQDVIQWMRDELRSSERATK